MTHSQRNVLADSAVAAVAMAGFSVMCAVQWALDPGDHVRGDPWGGFGLFVMVLLSLPAWYAGWALVLRIRQRRLWWLTPVVAPLPGVWFVAATEHRAWNHGLTVPLLVLALITVVTAAGCSMFVETLPPRLRRW